MQIEAAHQRDYAELMDLMVRCFRTVAPDHPRFENMLPDLYQPTEGHMARHRLIREDGRIVSSLGIYPMDLKIGEVRLRAAGIGGVCTAPESRGRGHMAALLKTAREEITRDGYALSWLSGLRDRYARFGWEMAGSEIGLSLLKPKRPGAAGPWKVVRWDAARGPLDAILAARARLTTRGECDEATLRLKLGRGGMEAWEARRGEAYAYVVIHRKMRWVCEWGGAPEGVMALLRECTDADGAWAVRLPPLRDEYTDLFLDAAERTGCRLANVSIFDLAGLLRCYEPFLASVWPRGRSLRLVVEPEGLAASVADGRVGAGEKPCDVELKLGLLQMTSLLFGPAKPSLFLGLAADQRWLDEVLPLPFYVPMLWGV